MIKKRKQELDEYLTKANTAGFGQYVTYNKDDLTVEIDWNSIEALQD